MSLLLRSWPIGLALALGAPALGQDALGSGDALDANQRRGSGGRNQINAQTDFFRELQFRNAIVTGNAPDGRSFRGDVGYTAADDFRGTLGSDTIFEFQRDSIYSGLATRSLRGIQALRFGLEQPVANQTRELLGGGLIISRGQSGASARQVTQRGVSTIELDPFGHLDGSIRSTSDFYLASDRFPRVLETYTGRDGMPTYVTGSDLLGIRPIRANNRVFRIAPVPLAAETEVRPGGALDPLPDLDDEDASERSTVIDPDATDRVEGRIDVPTMHEQLLESLRESINLGPELQQTGLRRTPRPQQVEPVDEPPADERAPPILPERDDADAEDETSIERRGVEEQEFESYLERLRVGLLPETRAGRRQRGEEETGRGAEEAADADEEEELSRDELVEEARRLLGGARRLETLVAQAGVENIYELHMKRGQELLIEERWFDAEERFSAALRARAGDPMAAAGRVSAQIGAGMFRSASVNLTNLLTAYPEMIGVRLSEDLFPHGERLVDIVRQLQFRSKRDTDVGRDAALLLAHVGFQAQQRDLTIEGFAAIDRIELFFADQIGRPVSEPSNLEAVLRDLWLAP